MSDLNTAVTIREATEADVPDMLAIYNHAVLTLTATADLEPRSLGDRLEWYRSRKSAGMPIVVAVAGNGHIAGWASLGYFHARAGYMHTLENSIYIAEDMRGKKIGSALLAELIERAQAMPEKIHVIVAAIDGENEASVKLHRSFGFVDAGNLPQVMTKFGRWLDLIYMVKMLD